MVVLVGNHGGYLLKIPHKPQEQVNVMDRMDEGASAALLFPGPAPPQVIIIIAPPPKGIRLGKIQLSQDTALKHLLCFHDVRLESVLGHH